MHVVLFESPRLRQSLLPLSYTRASSELRIGILSVSEKWAIDLGSRPFVHCSAHYLQPAYRLELSEDTYFVSAHLCPDRLLVDAIRGLERGEAIFFEDHLLAARPLRSIGRAECLEVESIAELLSSRISSERKWTSEPRLLCSPYQALDWNGDEMVADLERLALGPVDPKQRPGLRVYGTHSVYLSEDVHFHELVCNTEQGPIYIGEGAQIEEGVYIQGPSSIGAATQLRTGARIRANTSIGPSSKIGGEVSDSIILGYSNKAHDGFLGTSLIGSWCNLGAGTSCSNLKNNYKVITFWDEAQQKFASTGRQFAGLVMGDYAKSAINQSFNSGSWVGPFSNVWSGHFPPQVLKPFSWAGPKGARLYLFKEAVEAADRMMKRRGKELSEVYREIFSHIFKETEEQWKK